MRPTKIVIHYPDGSTMYTDNIESIRAIGKALPPSIVWNKTAKLASLRAKYYLLIDELVKNTNAGYNKTDLHEAMKPLVMTKFADFPHYFETGKPEFSTRHLTTDGWHAMIDGLKVVAMDIYQYIFKA